MFRKLKVLFANNSKKKKVLKYPLSRGAKFSNVNSLSNISEEGHDDDSNISVELGIPGFRKIERKLKQRENMTGIS